MPPVNLRGRHFVTCTESIRGITLNDIQWVRYSGRWRVLSEPLKTQADARFNIDLYNVKKGREANFSPFISISTLD